MSRAKKELSKLLERYDNSAEDFYFQMKRYYESGIVTSVKLPFTPNEVKENPQQAVNYLLAYKAFSYNQVKDISEFMSVLFELGPVLFKGDQVSVNILDEKVKMDVPDSQIDMESKSEQSYTVSIKLLNSGIAREKFESGIKRDEIAEHLKDRLKQSIYLSLRTILFDGFSDNPESDLKAANEISQPMGVVISEAKDVEKILTSPYNTDLGLRDLEQLYVLHDLLEDENWWVFHDPKDLAEELKIIINKSRQLRIDSPICE